MNPLLVKRFFASAALFLAAAGVCRAQEWPKSILTASGTVINLYQPEFLSYTGNNLKAKSVISIITSDDEDPVFGLAWTTAMLEADSAGSDTTNLAIQAVRVDAIKITGDTDHADEDFVAAAMEVYMPWVVGSLPVSAIRQSMAQHRQEMALAKDSSVPVPQIIFRDKPTVLVQIDGEPRLEKNEHWGVDAVANSRYVIVHDKDGKYYLYGGGHWYVAPAATGPYAYGSDKVSKTLKKIAKDLKKAARKDDIDAAEINGAPIYQIAVSTVPTVLIQSDGPAEAVGIPGTRLSYIMNSRDNIFTDSTTGQYYLLTAGQWFRGGSLTDSTGWKPVEADRLPPDFAQIPTGSLKAAVREDVGGTPEHREATRQAEVPQTLKVDRWATTEISYDGAPRFSPILGTNLSYATNTCSIVLSYNGQYYALDDGVWFVAASPIGKWEVSNRRPADVELIPRSYRAYAAKFVYVYLADPDFVYEGYMPGYTGMPGDDCALSQSYSNSVSESYWDFDLDCVFGWGGGWYDGFYWFTGRSRYYGHNSGGGGIWKGTRPWAGGAPGGGHNPGGGIASRGGFVAPRPPRGWQPRMHGSGHVIGYNNGWAGSGGAPRHVRTNATSPGNVGGGTRGFASGGRNFSSGGNSGSGSRGYSGGGSRGSRGSSGGGGHVSSGGGGHVSSGGGSRGSSGGGGGGHVSSGGGGGGHASSGGGGGGGGGHSGGGSSGGSSGGHH